MSRRGSRRKDALPPLPAGGLRVVPLGGLGEIGRNMTVFEHAGRLLIVDCGVLFPEEHQPGVDVILPDFTWIRDRLDDVVAIVLTHGHEDHIGGVPYLLRERPDIPVVGSKLTLALHRGQAQGAPDHARAPSRSREGDTAAARARSTASSSRSTTRSPTASPSRSAPRAGLVLHTGDFKMDQFPLDGRITDLRGVRPARRGGRRPVPHRLHQRRGPRLHHRPSATSRPAIEQVFRTAPRRVIVVQLRQPRAPHPAGPRRRARATAARSPSSAARWCATWASPRDLGYLKVPDGLVVDLKQLEKLPANKIALVCTGSQGEPMAALSRMANRDHPIRVGEGDTVLLASSLIPGNENAIYRVINGLTRWGANVVHKGNAKVHVSGHASAGELVYCYNIVQPAQRHAGPRRVAPPARPTPTSPISTGVDRRRASSSPRTASSSTSSTAARRSPARSRPATCTSTARPSAAPPRRR